MWLTYPGFVEMKESTFKKNKEFISNKPRVSES
jgi:hypothetical protein